MIKKLNHVGGQLTPILDRLNITKAETIINVKIKNKIVTAVIKV